MRFPACLSSEFSPEFFEDNTFCSLEVFSFITSFVIELLLIPAFSFATSLVISRELSLAISLIITSDLSFDRFWELASTVCIVVIKSVPVRVKSLGKIKTDHYGRPVPVHSHGTSNFPRPTSAGSELGKALGELFDRIVNPLLLIRRLTIGLHRLTSEADAPPAQLELFVDYDELTSRSERERRRQEAILGIKKQFGKNAILTGLNYADGATQRQRNSQIGGHKA